MSDQLSRIETKVDKIAEDVALLREGRVENKTAIKGHTTQLFLLWTALFTVAGAMITAYFKL